MNGAIEIQTPGLALIHFDDNDSDLGPFYDMVHGKRCVYLYVCLSTHIRDGCNDFVQIWSWEFFREGGNLSLGHG